MPSVSDTRGNVRALRRQVMDQLRQAIVEKQRFNTELALSGPEHAEVVIRLEQLRQHCAEDSINVMVIGEMARGKTTVVNTLLGEVRLPAGENPCTAAVVEVRHGDPASSEVYLKCRSTPKIIPTEELPQYCATPLARENLPQDHLQIERIVTYCNSPILEDGVVIIDTPGLNDIDSRIQRTLWALNKADIFLIVLSAVETSPAERAFLTNELPRWLGEGPWENVIVLWNKWDELESLKQHRSSAFHNERLGEIRSIEASYLLKHIKSERILRTSARPELEAILGIEGAPGAGRRSETEWSTVLATIQQLVGSLRDGRRLVHPLTVLEHIVDQWVSTAAIHRAATSNALSRGDATTYEKELLKLETAQKRTKLLVQVCFAEITTEIRGQYVKFLRRIEESLRSSGQNTELKGGDLFDFTGLEIRARTRRTVEKYFREQQEAWWSGQGEFKDQGPCPETFIRARLEKLKTDINGVAKDYADQLSELKQRLTSTTLPSEVVHANISFGNLPRNMNATISEKLIENAIRASMDKTFVAKESRSATSIRIFFDVAASGTTLNPWIKEMQAQKPPAKPTEPTASGGQTGKPATPANSPTDKAGSGGQQTKARADGQPADHPAADGKPADHPVADAKSADHPAADAKQPDHPAADVQQPEHPPTSADQGSHGTGDGHTGAAGHGGDATDASGAAGSHGHGLAMAEGGALVVAGIAVGQIQANRQMRTQTTEELVQGFRDGEKVFLEKIQQDFDRSAAQLTQQIDVDLFASANEVRQSLKEAEKLHTTDLANKQKMVETLKLFEEKMSAIQSMAASLKDQIAAKAGS